VQAAGEGEADTSDSTATPDGCELYPEPSEQQRRIANEMYRWTVGAYRGSGADKVQALCELNDVGVVMHNKKIRWAASV